MLPGLSGAPRGKPATKKLKTFGTKKLPPGAVLSTKEGSSSNDKTTDKDEKNGDINAKMGGKHGLENGSSPTTQKKQKSLKKVIEEEGLEEPKTDRFTFAVVCACNMNRSMAAHKLMQDNGYKVQSFGTARQVKLPGEDQSTTFPFGTSYKEILDFVSAPERRTWSEEKGVISMLERNVELKHAPERWQEIKDPHQYDVIICFESRVFEHLNEDLRSREPSGDPKSLHVINIETKDDTRSADQGAKYALQFADMTSRLPEQVSLDEGIDHLLAKIEKEIGADPLYVEHRL